MLILRTTCLSVLLAAVLTGLAHAQSIERLSDTWTGGEGQGYGAVISRDGHFVAFAGFVGLVPGETGFIMDVYVRDLVTDLTERVSLDSSGAQADGDSSQPAISADGRFVAFRSEANNLVPGDTNDSVDIFLRDRVTGLTTRISLDSASVQADGDCNDPSISTDGRHVAFVSPATNLVPGDTNAVEDVFVHDRQTGQTTCLSVDSGGTQGNSTSRDPALSADGRYAAFTSYASNLVAQDTNGFSDVFVHDRQTGQTTRVSVDSAGAEGNLYSWQPSISEDGRLVAFYGEASNLVPGHVGIYADVFVHDRITGETTLVSVSSAGEQGNQNSFYPSEFSADGRYLAFSGVATNLVPNDTSINNHSDVFVHDRETGQTVCVSVNVSDLVGNFHSGWPVGPSLSADGKLVVFDSEAFNLVPGDTFVDSDVFVRDLGCALPLVYCTAKLNSLGCAPSIALTSAPTASSSTGAVAITVDVRGAVPGLYFHAVGAPGAIPFHGGWLCVGAPVRRHVVTFSEGSPGTCQGRFSESLNGYIASGADPALVAGVTVNLQCWSRDPQAPFGDSLSDAVTALICP